MHTVLLVDDFEEIRQVFCAVLGKRPNFEVIGHAADGLEAVQKAEELLPDLVLLDIGLPKLNGIAVARLIRQRVPKLKILFLTQNTDPEIVEAALSTGASGYILKLEAGEEFFEALETVIQGGQYVSRALRVREDSGEVRHPDFIYPRSAG